MMDGDVTNDGQNEYLYDAEGRVCAVDSLLGRGMYGYLYNAEGVRVAKGRITTFSCNTAANGFQVTASYILDPNNRQLTELSWSGGTPQWAHTNVFAAGLLTATYSVNPDPSDHQPGILNFLLSDWLGTRRVMTDYAGNMEESCHSLPYGEGEDCAPTPTELLFTQKERDAESGNDYFGARYYASSMGRFLSPDPSGGFFADPSNPQSLNLYAYVMNNPLKFIDPTGYDCAYLNDAGDGIESLDQQSNSQECTQNGGYWADGAITNFQVNDNGGYTFTSLDANLNTLYTNFTGSSNTNSFANLDVTSYFANYQLQQRQLQGQSLLNMPQNQRIQQLAAGITKDSNCAVNSLLKGGSTAALDAAAMVPFGGDAEMAAPVAINAVSSVNSAAQGDATGSGLSTVNMVQGAVVNAVTSPSMGMNAPKAIPVAGQVYSAGLVARDVWNASGAYANCF